MALAVLRLIGEEVRKDRTTRVIAQLPVDVSTFLINEKREWLHRLESQREIDIVLVPDPNMQTPNYSIRRVRDDELAMPENAKTSYQLAGQGAVELDFQSQADKQPVAAPAAVQPIAPAAPAPKPVAQVARAESGPGFWARLAAFFRGGEGATRESAETSGAPRREDRPGGRHGRDHREDRGGRRPPHRSDRGPRRDRDRDRDRNRNRDRDRHRDDERGERPDQSRGGEPRDDQGRNRDRAPESQRPPQAAANARPEQQGSEGDAQRRRRRRGRGGRGRGRQESYRPNDTQPIAQGNGNPARAAMSPAPAPVSAPPSMDVAAAAPPSPPLSASRNAAIGRLVGPAGSEGRIDLYGVVFNSGRRAALRTEGIVHSRAPSAARRPRAASSTRSRTSSKPPRSAVVRVGNVTDARVAVRSGETGARALRASVVPCREAVRRPTHPWQARGRSARNPPAPRRAPAAPLMSMPRRSGRGNRTIVRRTARVVTVGSCRVHLDLEARGVARSESTHDRLGSRRAADIAEADEQYARHARLRRLSQASSDSIARSVSSVDTANEILM